MTEPEPINPPSTPPGSEHVIAALPGGPADFDRDIHCTGMGGTRVTRRKQFAESQRHAILRVMTVPSFFWIGVVITAALVVGGVLNRFGGVVAGIISGALCLSLVVPFIIWMKRRSAPKAPPEAKSLVANDTDERYRLRVVSTSRLVWALRDLSNQPFEPQVFPICYAVPARRWIAITLWIALSAAGFALWWWIKHKVAFGGFMLGGPLKTWEYWGVMALAAAPFAWTWPTYLRISPGRIDLFRYPFLGAGRPTVQTFDVRQARVLCQANGEHAFIMITPPGAEPVSIQLSRLGCKFYEVFRATFEAARWRGDLLTLPDDELAG